MLMMNLLTSCQEWHPPQTGSVQLKGVETLRPLLTMCAEDFMTRRPHVDVIVQVGGSGTGIAALLHGTTDIGMASRELSEKERQYAEGQGLFRQRILGDQNYDGAVHQMPINEAVVTEVASHPWAIGYTSFGAVQVARGWVKTVALQTSPQAPAVPPTPDTIRDQNYPLVRILHLYTASEPTGVVRDFIDFCLSSRGQELVSKAGYLVVQK
jgi:ABC-type phosphate transport system substrate-binding protein